MKEKKMNRASRTLSWIVQSLLFSFIGLMVGFTTFYIPNTHTKLTFLAVVILLGFLFLSFLEWNSQKAKRRRAWNRKMIFVYEVLYLLDTERKINYEQVDRLVNQIEDEALLKSWESYKADGNELNKIGLKTCLELLTLPQPHLF